MSQSCDSGSSPRLDITRVNNACVLIELGDSKILTDPYFIDYKMVGIKERMGMKVEDLPPLDAIIGCHGVIDHWQINSLENYPHDKTAVQVLVPLERMVKTAVATGFSNSKVVEWGNEIVIGNLTIQVVEAQRLMMNYFVVNNYVLRSGDKKVFFGSEARDLAPLKQYREKHGDVDVALFPTNAVHLFSFYKLVMSGSDAVKGANLLGAKKLFVIHDAHPTIPLLIRIASNGDEAEEAAEQFENLQVVRKLPGEPWTLE